LRKIKIRKPRPFWSGSLKIIPISLQPHPHKNTNLSCFSPAEKLDFRNGKRCRVNPKKNEHAAATEKNRVELQLAAKTETTKSNSARREKESTEPDWAAAGRKTWFQRGAKPNGAEVLPVLWRGLAQPGEISSWSRIQHNRSPEVPPAPRKEKEEKKCSGAGFELSEF
jgi:hypothetical protein